MEHPRKPNEPGPSTSSDRTRRGGILSQLLPSPDGTYQALVLEYREEANRPSLLKVVRSGTARAWEAESLREVTLNSNPRPRIAWMSDNTLVIDERIASSRPDEPGEVSILFSPWRAVLGPSESVELEQAGSTGRRRERPIPLKMLDQRSIRPADSEDPFDTLSFDSNVSEALLPSRRPIKVPPIESDYVIPGLPLTSDFTVLAGGAHSGKPSTVRIDQSGQNATTMAVSVDNPSKPVVLMLGAFVPTIWTIRCAPGTTLLAVLASGYHRQVVTGLDDITPVAIHTYANKSPCGFFSVDERRLGELNTKALRFFGREVNKVYFAIDGELVMGMSRTMTSRWVGRGSAPVESYIDHTPVVEEKTLDDAVREGLLRRANIADRHQWQKEMESLAASCGLPPEKVERRKAHLESSLMMSRAYVVLKPMTLPPNLCGSKSAVFFIPKGTEHPRGDPGHSTICDFNDMSCTGPFGFE